MKVFVHFELDDEAEFAKFSTKFAALKFEVLAQEDKTEEKAEKVKVAKVKQPESEPVQTDIEDAITYEQVKSAVLKVAKEKGKAAALRALDVIGTDKVGPHIKESGYSKLMAACEKELG